MCLSSSQLSSNGQESNQDVHMIQRPVLSLQPRRTLYIIIIVAISIATIAICVRNPVLSSTNVSYEYTDHSLASTTSKIPIDRIETAVAEVQQTSNPATPDKTTTKGLHLCTCLTPSSNHKDTETPKRLRWLHFPKTGTSFISTLWSYACSTRDRYIDLDISSFQCDLFKKNAFNMYDFALMKRYPWEIYGSPNFIRPNIPHGNDTPLGLVGGTQHMALTPSLPDANPERREKMSGLLNKMKVWGSELDNNFTVAAFFRQPEERIVSAYYDGRHTSGFDTNLYTAVKKATTGSSCRIDEKKYNNPLECFARYPGIAGCMTRMLTGEMCADGIFQDSGMENVPEAVDIVMNRLKFVGITEDWNESICQFHKLYAGKVDTDGTRYWNPPLQGEFANVHTSNKVKRYGIQDLHGFKDVADGVVYEAAKLKFQQIVGDNKCYKYMSWDELEDNANSNMLAERMPYLKTHPNGAICRPKSCTDLQKQCGEWDDGCGSTVICGICNGGRTSLPETWRVQCIDGQCVDYCPPWDQKGYWFKSDIEKSKQAQSLGTVLSSMRDESYLSPILAVKICQAACSGSALKNVFDDSLCQCGETPTAYLTSNLTAADFSNAHHLKTDCHTAKANMYTLAENETQPICCAKIPDTAPSSDWKQLSVMSKVITRSDNIEGEYFAHIPMQCGGYDACETAGRKQKAELVVFDRYNSLCHLARNVFMLDDSYTVTKDNTHRYYLDLRKGTV